MTPRNAVRPPAGETEGPKITCGRSGTQSTEPTPAAAPNTLTTWPWARWDDYLTGYITGRADGITEGRRQADAEAAARHRAAADVVLAMTAVPVRDRAADAARRARWDARFGGSA